MALIKCKDCNTDVSDAAQMCPKCAAPLQGTMHDGAKTTIQFTSKNIKLHGLFAFLTALLGVIIIASSDSGSIKGTGSLLIFISIIWFIVNRVRKWWHHH